MSIYKYKINGHEHALETFGIEIGDYVTIVRNGQYFPSFTKLFKYFWGMNTYLEAAKKAITLVRNKCLKDHSKSVTEWLQYSLPKFNVK